MTTTSEKGDKMEKENGPCKVSSNGEKLVSVILGINGLFRLLKGPTNAHL